MEEKPINIVSKLRKMTIALSIAGYLTVLYGSRNAISTELQRMRGDMSSFEQIRDKHDVTQDLNFIDLGFVVVASSMFSFLILQAVGEFLQPSRVIDLPIHENFPTNIRFKESFLSEIRDAKKINDIVEEVCYASFIIDPTSSEPEVNENEPVALIRTGKFYVPYFLSSAESLYDTKKKTGGHFRNYFGEELSIRKKDDIIVVARRAFNHHLRELYAQQMVSSHEVIGQAPT